MPNMSATSSGLEFTRYAPGYSMPWHVHTYAKVSFLLAGSVLEGSRAGDRHCRAGEIVVKPVGIEHRDEVGPDGLCVLSIRPAEDVAGWKSLASGYRWLPFDPVVARIVRAFLQGEFLSGEALEEGIAALSLLTRAASQKVACSSHWAFRAVEILHNTYDRPPSLAELAQEIGAHPVSLAQALRQRTGKTKTEIVHQIRIQRALSMLQTEDRIAVIAADLGFSDQAHFCRVFKRWLGCSPSAYRRTLDAKH